MLILKISTFLTALKGSTGAHSHLKITKTFVIFLSLLSDWGENQNRQKTLTWHTKWLREIYQTFSCRKRISLKHSLLKCDCGTYSFILDFSVILLLQYFICTSVSCFFLLWVGLWSIFFKIMRLIRFKAEWRRGRRAFPVRKKERKKEKPSSCH